jgi:hypothetical protein
LVFIFYFIFFFSDGGMPSGLPYCIFPLEPLVLPGFIVAYLHAMASLHFIGHVMYLGELILAPT